MYIPNKLGYRTESSSIETSVLITQIFVPTAIQTQDLLQHTVHTTINLSGRLPVTDVNNSQHYYSDILFHEP